MLYNIGCRQGFRFTQTVVSIKMPVFEATFYESGQVVSVSHGAKRTNSLDDGDLQYDYWQRLDFL